MSALLLFWLRSAVPTATVIVVMIATAALSPLFSAWAGCAGLAAIHFWSVPQKIAMPASAVFALGVLQDAVLAAPLGMYACIWLGVYIVGLYTAFLPDKTRLLSLMLHFAIVSFLVPILTALVVIAQNQSLVNILGALIGWAACVAAYPVLARLLQPLEQKLLL